jgi:hypothetical protein
MWFACVQLCERPHRSGSMYSERGELTMAVAVGPIAQNKQCLRCDEAVVTGIQSCTEVVLTESPEMAVKDSRRPTSTGRNSRSNRDRQSKLCKKC